MFPASFMPFFRWLEHSWLGETIRSTTYTFPLVEVVHLLALTLLLGSVVLIDFRLLGVGMKRHSVSQVAAWVGPGVWIGLIGAVGTGIPLLASGGLKYFTSPPFFFKMIFLILSVLFYSTVHRKVAESEVPRGAIVQKLTALTSLCLWFGIGFMGRAIAFY